MFMQENIKVETQESTSPDFLHKAFFVKLFKSLTSHSETNRFIGHMFKSVFERIDFHYLDKKNLYVAFRDFKKEFFLNDAPEGTTAEEMLLPATSPEDEGII